MPYILRRRQRLCSSGCRGYSISALQAHRKMEHAKPEALRRAASPERARSVAGDLCLRKKERKPVLHPPPVTGRDACITEP